MADLSEIRMPVKDEMAQFESYFGKTMQSETCSRSFSIISSGARVNK